MRTQRTKHLFLIFFLLPTHLIFAENETRVTPEFLRQSIENTINEVSEFQEIKRIAENMGVRAWIFGGTAASLASHAKTAQEAGKKGKFVAWGLGMGYQSIMRANQDLDLVIDGTPQEAELLEKALQAQFPYFRGEGSAWEVRTLNQKRGTKEALLNNSEIENQHTDTQSAGLIEITHPKNNEPRVRDLNRWTENNSNFLIDMANGEVHFVDSKSHSSTQRAKEGMNPEILSAIRCLTKASQFGLKIDPSSMKKIQEIIKKTTPGDINHSYVQQWFNVTGTKLMKNAADVEYAEKLVIDSGLREKASGLFKSSPHSDFLTWIHKEPLKGFTLGSGSGPTAKSLGISQVTHSTRDLDTYDAIVRGADERPIAFKSRQNKEAAGERAKYGEGFYVLQGTSGAFADGMDIGFTLLPEAREGNLSRKSLDFG